MPIFFIILNKNILYEKKTSPLKPSVKNANFLAVFYVKHIYWAGRLGQSEGTQNSFHAVQNWQGRKWWCMSIIIALGSRCR